MELVDKKFAKMRAEVENKKIFSYADKRYLDPLYSSSDFLAGRDEKVKELLGHLVEYASGYVAPLISVYGKSGTGKTSIVKYVCENLDDAYCCMVNMRQAKTIFGCMNLILGELDLPSLKNASGLGSAIAQIEKQILSIANTKGKKLFVLVLDEIDVVFRDIRGDPSDFVYKLLLLQERLREKHGMMAIIGVSNGVISDYELDERVRSRLGSTHVFFGSYTKDEIIDILRERAKKAFAFNISERVLEYCAELSSIEHGDARRAIDLLGRSAKIAERAGESQKISLEDVDRALEELDRDRVAMMLRSSPYNLKIIAAVMAKMTYIDESKGGKEKWYTTTMIDNEYRKLLEDLAIEKCGSSIDFYGLYGRIAEIIETHGGPIELISYRRVSSLLVELCDMGIAIVQNESRGRHGRYSKYRLTVPAEIVGRASMPDWWEKATAEERKSIKTAQRLDMNARFRKAMREKIPRDTMFTSNGEAISTPTRRANDAEHMGEK